eukprot:CAMPEP_0194448040 /NCGR_PEP_ID=MMETSP0176-20130528/129348_1 /TAXON_ID=216777 /ORGANISM="Proboscia alata, Strain PI-D3" /LENGTH=300 /DNA_ID=CAMNT_0039274967 /DNA_START=460 /DNA_END=1359 /DNA_ORIENTATION=-
MIPLVGVLNSTNDTVLLNGTDTFNNTSLSSTTPTPTSTSASTSTTTSTPPNSALSTSPIIKPSSLDITTTLSTGLPSSAPSHDSILSTHASTPTPTPTLAVNDVITTTGQSAANSGFFPGQPNVTSSPTVTALGSPLGTTYPDNPTASPLPSTIHMASATANFTDENTPTRLYPSSDPSFTESNDPTPATGPDPASATPSVHTMSPRPPLPNDPSNAPTHTNPPTAVSAEVGIQTVSTHQAVVAEQREDRIHNSNINSDSNNPYPRSGNSSSTTERSNSSRLLTSVGWTILGGWMLGTLW